MANKIDLRNKNIGKIFIISIILIIGILSNVKAYNFLNTPNVSKSGIVLAKNDALTSGKYPRQKWVISFAYDDKRLGVRDINVTFSTWVKLNVGDRTSFKVNETEIEKKSNLEEFKIIAYLLGAGAFDLVALVFILMGVVEIVSIIWQL